MEWLKQLLEGAKITDGKLEVDTLITAINKELPKHTVPKETFNSANEQLKTANKTIDDLKKSNQDNTELQKTIEDHKKTIKKMEADHSEELKTIKLDTAINGMLSSNKAKHSELLSKEFDRSKLIVNEDGSITGLDEQFNGIKEKFADLFEAKKADENNDGDKGDNSSNKQAYTYTPKGGSEGSDDLATIAMNAVLGL